MSSIKIEESEEERLIRLELESRICSRYFAGNETLYSALMYHLCQPRVLPHWIVGEVLKGFDDRIAGKTTLDKVFGLTPRPGVQLDKSARRLTYGPSVYWEVKARSENGQPIDIGMFEEIAEVFKPTFLTEWPHVKPPGGATLKEWYLWELKLREPELAKKRVKSKSKND